MFTCPNDRRPLTRLPLDHGACWSCATCGGRAVGLGVLRRTVVKDAVNQMWQSARTHAGAPGRPCAVCGRPMTEVRAAPAAGSPLVEICRSCHMVWFDAGEFDLVPALPAAEHPLPPQIREALALEKVAELAQQARSSWTGADPDEWWKYLPGLLGMPVEYGDLPMHRMPYATWTLAALITVVSVAAFSDLSAAILEFGLIPAQAGRDAGLTFLTSFLLHGGLFHLIGNLYFLLVFGDNVEDYLGTWRYLFLILMAAFVGDLLHVALEPRSDIPTIGASGGISGIIAFYVLKFPRARLGFLTGPLTLFTWIRMPAYAVGILWLIFQIVGAWQQIAGTGNVSALAHLGGAVTGVVFWLTYRP